MDNKKKFRSGDLEMTMMIVYDCIRTNKLLKQTIVKFVRDE